MRLSVIGLVLPVLVATAAAQTLTIQPGTLTTPQRQVPAYNLPAAPALPTGCVAPTKEKCADATYYTTDVCAKDPTKAQAMTSYCTWVLQKAWVDTSATIQPAIFPKSPPSLNAYVGPGKRMDHDKETPAVKLNRPTTKRRYPGKKPTTQVFQGASALTSTNLNPTTSRGGGGSASTLQFGSIVTARQQVDRDLAPFRAAPTTAISALQPKATAIGSIFLAPPGYISQGPSVSTCEEYSYKHWGDYSSFASAARKLGINYRQVYSTAIDPTSPVYFNKQLMQTATSTPTPKQLKLAGSKTGEGVYPNVMVLGSPAWFDDPKATTENGKPLITDPQKVQIRAAIDKRWNPIAKRPIEMQARTDGSPLGFHKEMKALFDKKYDPLDDELDDIAKRLSTYQDLYARAVSLSVALVCAQPGDLCYQCSPRPAPRSAVTGALGALQNKITGATVINPADARGLVRSGDLVSLQTLGQLSPMMRTLNESLSKGAINTKAFNQKTLNASMQVQSTATTEQAACLAKMAAKIPALEDALRATDRELTKMLVNELSFGPRGCLADPGSDLGNMCDWSYRFAAEQMTNAFAADVQADLAMCRAHVAEDVTAAKLKATVNPFTQILKSPPSQTRVYPCTQRRDFTGSAPDAAKFFELDGNPLGRTCEAEVQNQAISAQQAGVADKIEGIQWSPDDGKLFDHESDSLTLGDQSSLGAYFTYDASWDMHKTGQPKDGDPMKSCKFEGAAATSVKAGIYFFGDTLDFFNISGSGSAVNAPTTTLTASYLDMDTLQAKSIASVFNRPVPPGTVYLVPFSDPPIDIGGIEYGFWVSIGPIPLHVIFGANARAGIEWRFQGNSGDNCSDLNKSSNFRLEATVDPWVQADAYADASVDVIVASAGIRLDLTLLRLSLPVGVNITSGTGTYVFKNGAQVSIDMLSGKLSGYAEVGISPFDVSYEATIFDWDGFHTDVPIFGVDKSLSQDTVRIAMAGQVTAQNASCVCADAFCCSNVSCTGSCSPNIGKAVPPSNEKKLCSNKAPSTQCAQFKTN